VYASALQLLALGRDYEAMTASRICDRAAREVRNAAVNHERCGFLYDPIGEMPE
jgi:hypothetical protein